MDNEFNKLAKLLRTRLKIIADHEFREKDPDSHLEALKEISMAIENEYNVLEKSLEPRFCLLYTSPSPRDLSTSRMPSSA